MTTSQSMVAVVLAGGEGTRLRPLTNEEAKPALNFVDGYRLVDFVLSNLVNSGIEHIYVLAQYKPASLIEHIDVVWGSQPHVSISVLLPHRPDGFKGTADAVHQNLHVVNRHRPDVVGIFAADHVYRMDLRQMAAFHREHAASVTVAAVPVPIEQASGFGIMATDETGAVRAFQEKPANPAPMPANPRLAYASMGNYLFDPETLQTLLDEAARTGGTDFGHHILPHTPGRQRVYAYNLAENRVPGVRDYEEHAYWRDVGTLQALARAKADARGPYPRFSLDNPRWPIRGTMTVDARAEPALAGIALPARRAAHA